MFACKEELRRFPHWYIESVNSTDGRVLWSNQENYATFRAHLWNQFACFPEFSNSLSPSTWVRSSRLQGVGYGMWSLWYIEAGGPQQVTGTGWFTLWSVRDRGVSLVVHGSPFASRLTAKVSTYADAITIFVFRFSDISAVKEAVAGYERIARAKINFDKNRGLWLGAWRGDFPLPGPFRWSDGPIRILGVWFWPDLQLEKLVGSTGKGKYLASMAFVLKGQGGGVHHVHLSPSYYRLSQLPRPTDRKETQERFLFSLLWKWGECRLSTDRSAVSVLATESLGCPTWEAIGLPRGWHFWVERWWRICREGTKWKPPSPT